VLAAAAGRGDMEVTECFLSCSTLVGAVSAAGSSSPAGQEDKERR